MTLLDWLPMRKKPWWSLSFLGKWFLGTLSFGGGTWFIARVLSFFLRGKDVPSTALPTWYFLCCIVASWALWYREHRARLALENPEYKPGPNVHVVSAAVIKSEFDGKKYLPFGSSFGAICTLYNLQSAMNLRDVRVQIEFRKKGTAELCIEIKRGVWLNEEAQNVNFKPGTIRDVVIAEWSYGQRVRIPRWRSDDVEKEEIPVSVEYDVYVALYSGNQSFSQHLFLLSLQPGLDTGFGRVEWSVKRTD
jgi:hypothetical protein